MGAHRHDHYKLAGERGDALEGPLEGVEAAELIRRVTASGLRGRGGGWFPTGRKWHAVRSEGGEPFLVANGAEGEPGSVKDRFLMTTRAKEVIRGLALAARAVGAREAVIFLKGSFRGPADALRAALATAPPALSVAIRHGDDGYISGEETAVLEALEGRRPWPRPKPPLPAAVGFQGRPTLVQNVETLARVPSALSDPEAFFSAQSTFVSLWGQVRRPGVYEVPLGTPLRRLIEEEGGGTPEGLGMIFPAGPSAAPLSAGQADTPLDPDALRAAGSALGTAAILVLDPSACPLAVAASLAAFFERESCGQCPPCTVGTASLARIVRTLEGGQGRGRDLADVAQVSGFMASHGYCAHSRTAAASVTGLLARFPTEVEDHRRLGRCPRTGRPPDPFASDSPERMAIEAVLAGTPPAPLRAGKAR